MKLYLFFFLFSQLSFGQIHDVNPNQFDDIGQLDSLLQGDWYLSETEIVDGYGYQQDSNRFFSSKYNNRKITFDGNILKAYPDTTLRFYTGGIRDYLFKLEYDSIYQASFLEVINGSKRKKQEIESYEVVKCTGDELILKSYKYLNSAIDLTSISVYYTYRRESVDSLLSMLKGKWFFCSQEYRSFGISADDPSKVVFKRETICDENDNYLELNFHRRQYDNICSVWGHNNVIGGAYELPFMIEPKNNLLLFGKDELIVYEIINVNESELILLLKNTNTHNTH